jgi:hypothetical protein
MRRKPKISLLNENPPTRAEMLSALKVAGFENVEWVSEHSVISTTPRAEIRVAKAVTAAGAHASKWYRVPTCTRRGQVDAIPPYVKSAFGFRG